MEKRNLGFALCGSFCTFEKAFLVLEKLVEFYSVTPIFSENAASFNTRFGTAEYFKNRARDLCGRAPLCSIVETEPLGPQNLIDALLIMPCTGNTAGKLSRGITDTSVTMAAKSLLRVNKPVILALSSNDSLGATGQNLGRLFNTKNFYFVPLSQDDPKKKPYSLSADFEKAADAVEAALSGRQLQPIFG